MNTTLTTPSRLAALLRRAADEAAEGVISTAIAVLILAFVGAGMFIGFQALAGSGCDAAAETLNDATGGDASCEEGA